MPRYSVPYNGEDVHFHWRSKGSHYIKTTEELKSYSFRSNEWRVRFELVEAFQEPDNVKGNIRYFIPMAEECRTEVTSDGDLLVVPFAFRRLTAAEENRYRKKSDEIEGDSIQERIIRDVGETIDRPEGVSNKDLSYHLIRYARKNRNDYFVHPQLGVFLRDELDYYLKNEFLDIDGLISTEAVADRIAGLRVLRVVGGRIVDMLDEIESFQAKLFEKRRLVISNSYLAPLHVVAEHLWNEVLENDAQIQRWRTDLGLRGRVGRKTLETHPSLVVDTSLFGADFQRRMLEVIDDIDGATDGLLINAENFGALRTIGRTFAQGLTAIYIDPPYNTGSDGFLYLDEFSRHSSWLALMDTRLRIARSLLRENGAIFISIDDNEYPRLMMLLLEVFGESNLVGDVAVAKGTSTGQDGSKFGSSVDHLLCFRKSDEFFPAGVPLSAGDVARFNREDERGKYSLLQLRKTGNNDRREDRPNLYYPVVGPDGTNVYPIGPTGYDSCWRVGKPTYGEWDSTGYIEWLDTKRGPTPYVKYYLEDRTKRPSTLWSDIEGNKAATRELKDLFGEGVFLNPKPTALVERVAGIADGPNPTILDFFAGSGTTGHAIIKSNRELGTSYKFVLVEMGEYFSSVLVPRIVKVMFSPEWKAGAPKEATRFAESTPDWLHRSPRLVQVVELESYEDSLNSLHAQEDDDLLVSFSVRYMIPASADSSLTLLATDRLVEPFEYRLEVHTEDGVIDKDVDLVTTFNLMKGIRPKRYREIDSSGRRYVVVEGIDGGDKVLVLWRSVKDLDPEAERAFLETEIPAALGTKLADYAKIWHNADSALPNSESLDAEFKRLMFEPEPALA